MKRRLLAALLAAAMVLSLAACGGKGGGSASVPGNNPSEGSSSSTGQPDGAGSDSSDVSAPDVSQPDASQPGGDASSSEGTQPGGDASSSSGSQSSGSGLTVTLTLNKSDVTLKKAGATVRLRYTASPDTDGVAVFTSSKPEVAVVDEAGTVTAVAPGTATITVRYDGAEASCIIRCSWKEEVPDASQPSGGSGSSSGSSSSGGSDSSGGSSAAQVDLQAFYDSTTGKYDFAFMTEADTAALDSLFSGLSGLTLSQQVIYLCGMMPSPNGDFALVQVSDAKDADAVKAIFQARIDYMVGDGNGPGGAYYPMEQTMWEENARIVSNGSYVMLIVHEKCDEIAAAFNALF